MLTNVAYIYISETLKIWKSEEKWNLICIFSLIKFISKIMFNLISEMGFAENN